MAANDAVVEPLLASPLTTRSTSLTVSTVPWPRALQLAHRSGYFLRYSVAYKVAHRQAKAMNKLPFDFRQKLWE